MTIANIRWLGHASFRIDDGGTYLYVDPWKVSPQSPKADLLLITHSHYDHFSPDDVARLTGPDTVIVAPRDVASQLKGNIITVEPGKTFSALGREIQTVPAYNIGKKFHPKSSGWVGYRITLSDGVVVFHAGDTDGTPELKSVQTDVALLPCGGTYTMNGKEAADAANSMKVNTVVPMHWGTIVGTKADAEELKEHFRGETVIKAPER